MRKTPEHVQRVRALMKSLGGAKKTGAKYGYSRGLIDKIVNGDAEIPFDMCEDLGIPWESEIVSSQTKEMMKFIDFAGGKPAAAKQLQIDVIYLNRLMSDSDSGNTGFPPHIAERAEISSDGLVSKFRLVFAVPSISNNFHIKIYSAVACESKSEDVE